MAKRSLKMASLKMATPPGSLLTCSVAAHMLDRCSHAREWQTWLKWQRSLKTAMRPENGIRLSIWRLQRRRSVQLSWSHSEPTRPPSCVARWERGGCAALRCHSRKWESAVCGALVGTRKNSQQQHHPADHRSQNKYTFRKKKTVCEVALLCA